jgi:hypothetical protein
MPQWLLALCVCQILTCLPVKEGVGHVMCAQAMHLCLLLEAPSDNAACSHCDWELASDNGLKSRSFRREGEDLNARRQGG